MAVAIILPLDHPERDIDAETAAKLVQLLDVALWVRTFAEKTENVQEQLENEVA